MKIIVSFCLGDTMRYDALIKYKGNELKIKVQQKALGSTFTLPDFIKTVRLENNKTIEYEMIEEQRVIIELAAFMWETSI